MKRPSRKIWYILGALATLTLVAVLLLPLLVDVNRYRGLIQARAEEALGREVGLGELSLSLLPLGVRVDALSISALPEEGGGKLLTAESVHVGARLLPLLGKRLEVTAIRVVAPRVTLLRDRDGRWNVQRLVASSSAEPATGESRPTGGPTTGGTIHVDSFTLTDGQVLIRDEGPGRSVPVELTLADVELSIRDFALDSPFDLELSGRLDTPTVTTFELTGRTGPLARGAEEALSVSATIKVDDFDPEDLLPWFEGTALPQGLQVDEPFSLTADLETTLSGELGLDATGRLELSDATVSFAGLDGSTQTVPIDLGVRFDVEVGEAGAELRLNELAIEIAKHTLGLRGTLRREGALQRVDLELLPSSLLAADLVKLVTLIGVGLPIGVASSSPIEFEGAIRGLVGPDHQPDVEAKIRVKEFTLSHPTLAQPVEQVAADVSLRGEHVEVTGLRGVVGSSDLSGDITLDGFSAPKVGFELHSRNADFGELFSFLDLEQGTPSASTSPTTEPTGAGGSPTGDPLANLELAGTIRIDRGTFQTLDFNDLEARMTYARRQLALDPMTMELYQGTFRGRIQSDLSGAAPTFAVRGDAEGIDVEAFANDNLELQGLIAGRFSGQVQTRGAGTDYESIVRSLDGNGSITIDQGNLGGLNLLERLSTVSGLFGEQTLAGLGNQLAVEGTDFDLLTGQMRVSAGSMHLDALRFDSPVFSLSGESDVDLLAATLDGEFRLILSRELSASMRTENSRAAKVFWNSGNGRIELPLTLSGPFTAPSPGIDFGAVAENLAREEVRGYLRDRLGLGGQEEESATPQPGAAAVPTPATERKHPGLDIEFEGTKWQGSILAKDLQVWGKVRGEMLDHASLVLTDSGSRRIEDFDRIEQIDAHLAGVADRQSAQTIQWDVKLDGRRLLLAEFPVTVTVTLFNTSGQSTESSLEVDR